MRPRASVLAVTAIVVLSAAEPIHVSQTLPAQTRRAAVPQLRRERPMVALEANGVFTTVRGDARGIARDGNGFNALASIGSGVFSLGVGYERSTHSETTISDRSVVDGFFIEPRVALPVAAGNFTPYVFAHAARLTRRVDLANREDLQGTALGGGIGTYFWLAPNVQLSTAVLLQDIRFDRDAIIGQPLFNDRAQGTQWGVRAGLSVGFDQWGR
jgi:hypothetical protein